jgi:hypothetical protein
VDLIHAIVLVSYRQLLQLGRDVICGAGVSVPVGVDVVGVHGRRHMLLFKDVVLLTTMPSSICCMSTLEAHLTNGLTTATTGTPVEEVVVGVLDRQPTKGSTRGR